MGAGPPYFMACGLGRMGRGVFMGAGPPYFVATGCASMVIGRGCGEGPPYLVATGGASMSMGLDGPALSGVGAAGSMDSVGSEALDPFLRLHAARKADTADVPVNATQPPAAPVSKPPKKDRRLVRFSSAMKASLLGESYF